MNPLLKLLAANRAKGKFKVEALEEADEATIYLYDMIVDSDLEAEYWGGVSPEAFTKALVAIKAPTIHLRVNSPGGSVFAARAIEQAIREHPSDIIVHVDGLAASAASFLIMAAKRIQMAPGAFLMIHKAWTIAWGNADDLVKASELLTQIDGSLVKTYSARTGQKADDIAEWLAAETWLVAERAVELGFADEVADEDAGEPVKNLAPNWDLSAYAGAPAQPKGAPTPGPKLPLPQQADRDALRRNVLRALIPA